MKVRYFVSYFVKSSPTSLVSSLRVYGILKDSIDPNVQAVRRSIGFADHPFWF